jgi:hypothetical protein
VIHVEHDGAPPLPTSEEEMREGSRAHTPLQCGSFDYCISEEHLSDFLNNVKTHAKTWQQEYSPFISPGRVDTSNCKFSQCCRTYGAGICEASLSQFSIDRVRQYKAQLHALSKLAPATEGDFKSMLLFFIKPVANEADSSDVLPAGRLALLLLTMNDFPIRQVYIDCEPQGPLEEGALANVSLRLANLSDIAEMSMWMLGLRHDMELWTLTYEFTSLQQLRVLSMLNSTLAVNTKVVAAKVDQELAFIKKLNTKPQAKRPGRGGPELSQSTNINILACKLPGICCECICDTAKVYLRSVDDNI